MSQNAWSRGATGAALAVWEDLAQWREEREKKNCMSKGIKATIRLQNVQDRRDG
jgi:hypothetical protein